MANEIGYSGDPSNDSGLTILGRVYDSSGTQVGSDVTCTEVGSLAIYLGDMPTASAGLYLVRFFDGTTLKGEYTVQWNGSSIETGIAEVDVVEGSLSVADAIRVMLAESAGKVSVSADGLTIRFRDQADTKDRIVTTADEDGQRTNVIVDGS